MLNLEEFYLYLADHIMLSKLVNVLALMFSEWTCIFWGVIFSLYEM